MKTRSILRGTLLFASIAGITVSMLLSFAGCDNKDYSNDSPFDNVVYLDVAKLKDVSNFTFNRTIETGRQVVSAQLARPATDDINVTIKADPSLVNIYNARLGTDYGMLDSKYYKLSAQETIISQGEITSDPISIDFFSLNELDIDASYLLPITIEQVSGGMGILNGSKSICYIVRRSSAITTAVSLKDNYFEVPGFDAESPTADIINNMTQLTYEAIIRVNSFKSDKFPMKEIATIMGIEQYCLFRIGDAGFPAQQLQFSSPGENKFPNADNSKLLQPNEWYHVAVTYDTEHKTGIIYVDGKEQSRIENYGNGEPVNLGKQTRGKDFMFKIGHSYGDPDYMERQLDGEICEVRIWNVARSQKEIFENMYSVEPTTPGLCAYWKFNEGEGDVAKDYTGNGNDAKAYAKATWPDGIEVTQKN